MQHRWVIGLCVALTAAGCSDFPDLSDSLTDDAQRAAYPELVSVNQFPDSSDQDADVTAKIVKNILARAKALRRKARALRGPVIDARTRGKLRRASQRHKRLNGS